ncbi:MAG: glycosyltransferase [Coriobacteriia bacterium]|nr:glycosyltransferase [Coriobacteriia bacterium]
MAPRFSVIMPTHQAAAFIERTIRCVLDQTCADWELVIVDNGSTDGTDAIVASFDDARIRYAWQEDSGLPANSRNNAIRMATGDFLAFLDADDWWAPTKLERVAAVLDADPAIDLVCHDVNIVDPTGRVLVHRTYVLDQRDAYTQLLHRGCFLTTSATVLRRSRALDAGLFDERRDFLTVEDFDLWLKVARAGARFRLINETLGTYLVHSKGALNADIERNYDNMFAMLHTHYLPLAAAGQLDVSAVLVRRARAGISTVRVLARGRRIRRALARLIRLPAEILADRAAYRAAAGDPS